MKKLKVNINNVRKEGNEGDIGATLAHMMGAMEEIQQKGDNILASIQTQRKILEELQEETKQVQKDKEAIILETDKLEDRKLQLETELTSLSDKKTKMKVSMEEEKQEMTRFVNKLYLWYYWKNKGDCNMILAKAICFVNVKWEQIFHAYIAYCFQVDYCIILIFLILQKLRQISTLQPLEKELKKKKLELSELESEVKNKKSELGNFNTELKKIKKDIGTASNKVGGSKTDVGFEPSPILLVALIISLSLNLFAISQLGNIGLLQRR